jgi:bacterioferritin (cytochrome b1)
MQNQTEIGANRTGLQMSPADMKKMVEVTGLTRPSSEGDAVTLSEVRDLYIEQADPVGTVPPPVTVKGVMKNGMQALTGRRAQVLLDKLGERMAFERSGTRLYQAFIMKCQAPHEGPDVVPLEKLEEFCAAELQHFQLVAECIEMLGGDPTAQTPCADLTGVECAGLMQVISDPKTNINQSLHAILVAELVDNAAWEELIVLARDMGQKDMAQRFEKALEEEEEHLQHIKQWHQEATLAEAGAAA